MTQLTSASHIFSYDSASRLTNLSDGVYSAGYSYLANSPLVSQMTFSSNGVMRMTTSKSHDYLSRLHSITSVGSTGAGAVSSFSYLYNDANQRIRTTLADGSSWVYEYDALGQVMSGKKYWVDGTPVAGQQFEYGFDDIGNRASTKAGGDANGAGLMARSFGLAGTERCNCTTAPRVIRCYGLFPQVRQPIAADMATIFPGGRYLSSKTCSASSEKLKRDPPPRQQSQPTEGRNNENDDED
jgi:YD repeat-containing protein